MNADTAKQSRILMFAIIAAVVVEAVLGSFSFPPPRRTLPADPQGAGQHHPPQVHHQTTDAYNN